MSGTAASAPNIARLVLAIGALALFVGGGSRFAIGLALKPMQAELESGRSLIGSAVALFQIVSAVAMLWSGRLADRMNPGRVLAGGVVLAALGIGALAWARGPVHVLLLYGVVFAAGNGIASVIPVGVLITRHYPDRAGLAGAIALAGLALGQLVMMLTFTPVLSVLGWRAVFGWLGIVHLVVALLLVAAVSRLRQGAYSPPMHLSDRPGQLAGATSAPTSIALSEVIRTPRFLLLVGIYALCGFEDFFVSTHIVAFAQDCGVDSLLAGQLLAFMGLAALLGVLMAGASGDRIGPAAATLICFLVRIALFGVVLVDQSPPTVAAFALIFGGTFLVTAPLTVVFVRNSFGGRDLGALTGLITMVHHICGGLGALIGAWLFDSRGSYDAVLAMMLASSVMAGALTIAFHRVRSA